MSDLPPDPGAPPPPPPPPPSGAQPASLGIRFGARVLDAIIVGIPLAIILTPLGLGFGAGIGGSFIGGIINTIVVVGYFTFLESSRGQTLGKQLLNIRVVSPQGGLPTQQEAFSRNAWLLIGLIPIVGGLITLVIAVVIAVAINSSPEGIGTHDGWAGGTRVLAA